MWYGQFGVRRQASPEKPAKLADGRLARRDGALDSSGASRKQPAGTREARFLGSPATTRRRPTSSESPGQPGGEYNSRHHGAASTSGVSHSSSGPACSSNPQRASRQHLGVTSRRVLNLHLVQGEIAAPAGDELLRLCALAGLAKRPSARRRALPGASPRDWSSPIRG